MAAKDTALEIETREAGKEEGKGAEEKKVDEEFRKWRSTLRGRVYLSGEPGYDEARYTWNAAFQKSPALIIEPESASDVTRGFEYATQHKLQVRVKAGGHTLSGKSTGDGVLLFNMRKLNWVNVNVEDKTAWIGGGCLLKDVDKETAAYGLWTTMGTYSSTGVGLALHGGFGYLSPKYGLAVDNILELDVVTPDGKLLRANARQNADLFWGLRGAATHLGVVTQFKIQCYTHEAVVYGGMIIWSAEHFAKLFTHYYVNLRKWDIEFSSFWLYAGFPPMGGKKVCVGLFNYAGAEEKGKEIVDSFRKMAPPLVDQCQNTSYAQGVQRVLDPFFAEKASYYTTSRFLKDREISSDFIKDFTEGLLKQPENVQMGFEDFHGISQDKKTDFNAFSTRHHTFSMWYAVASPPTALDTKEQEKRDTSVQWARDSMKALDRYLSPSFYYNYSTTDDERHSQKNWGENYEKLAGLKKKYDPTGILLALG